MADIFEIAGRINSTSREKVVTTADQILADEQGGMKQSDVNAQHAADIANRYTKEETYNKSELNQMITTPDVEYVSVVATNATTAVTDVLPATGQANTIYRVGNWNGTQYDPTMYALYAWNGSAYVCLAARSFVGEVYDVSVNHPDGQGNPTPYADLTAALGTDGANIPADIRRGGMSIKYVLSSDNTYVQYRYMGTAVTGSPNPFLDTANWQGVDDEPTAGSKNLVESGGVEGAINDVEQVMFNTDTQKWVYSRTLPVPTATSTYFLRYLGKCNCKITIECSETTVNMTLRGTNKETGNSINLLAFEERSFPLTINNPRPELELINLFVLTASTAPACIFTVTIEKDNPFVGLQGEIDALGGSLNQKTAALAATEKEDKDNLDESYFNIDTKDTWIKKKFDIVPGNRYDILKYLGKTACTFTVEGSVSPAKIWMVAENIETGNTITLWGSNSGTVELPATFTNPRPDLELENLRIHTNGTGTRDTITVKVSKQSPIATLNNAIESVGNAVEAVEGEVDGIKDLVGDWPYEKIHYGVNDVTWETGAVRGGTGANSDTSSAMKRTNFISVEGLEEIEFMGQIAYKAGQTYGYSFYSDDDVSAFVGGSAFDIDTTLSAVTPKVYKVAVPAGAKYFRTCRTVAAVGDDWYLDSVLGTTITDEIDAIEDAIDEINKESEFCNGILNTFKSNFDGWYECQETAFAEGFSTWNEDNYQYPPTYATLIGLYDGFMADNAGRMTKYELGNGSGTDAGGNAYKLYEYRIVPKVVTHSLNKTVTPRVLIDATMHGHERNAAFALYYFIKDLLYNYDKSPILEYIRTFVEIRFIPISNPWGFEHNQYVNANGVNLNRNFPTDGWQVVTTPADQATGAEPLNQPESIILDNWLKANKDEMLMHLNLHTNGARTASVDYANSNCLMPFEYDDVYYDRLFSAIQRHIQYQTLKFSEEYENINPGYSQVIGRYQTGTPTTGTRGNIDEYGVTKLNIISMTFEMFGGIKDSNNDPIVVGGSTQSQKMCAEMLGNFIARVLQEYSE